MAYRSLAFNNEIIWRAPLPSAERELANAIRDKITALRPHLLDFIRLNEEAPHHALTLAEWSQPATLSSLIATYSDHIYRNQPGQAREQKPLLSLWAQWYIGLLVPPLMLALLSEERAVSLAPGDFGCSVDCSGADWRRVGAGVGFPGGDSGGRPGLRFGDYLLPVLQGVRETAARAGSRRGAAHGGRESANGIKTNGRLNSRPFVFTIDYFSVQSPHCCTSGRR